MMLKKARFLKRLNRFVVECLINDKPVRAYLPNPGRLWEILLPGRTLYLEPSQQGLPYTVWASERDGNIICLHTGYTNRIAETLIERRLIPGLEDYTVRGREIRIGRHRIDLFLQSRKGELLTEVKSCTLFHKGMAMFPDAVTERGRKHLELLARHRGCVLFIAPYPELSWFLPDFHTDPEFSKTLYELRKGLLIKPVAIRWNRRFNFEFVKPLHIPWEIYEREALDKGSYLIVGRLGKSLEIPTGALGRISYKKGFYIYVGSAMKSLSSRLRRHLRTHKVKRWHIDYVMPFLEDVRAIPIQSSEILECAIAQEMLSLSTCLPSGRGGYIKGFGSSDCSCRGHLFWMDVNPFEKESFINLILRFRIDRLCDLLYP